MIIFLQEAVSYDWEQHVLDAMVMPTGKVTKSAIVSFNDGRLRAAAPVQFTPDRKGIKDIICALQGNTSGIAKRGIALKSGTPVYTPGKMDANKAIYGTDGRGGGCSIFKTNQCILIVYYKSEPTAATRLACEVAEYMIDQGH
ncbi:hypothetical protein LSH36_1g01006 [Paralvinella palmiformis]|uniref:Profilin n=1 Tax=Paralvinella palmiformis TaxID=53620 RepID=A0AAD9KFD4_9ANNE|nr:hypothetical protein LSH36_1g01006 [Paralvinella palmiformis]